jgi:GNAT superfamily N-acetyltransferase
MISIQPAQPEQAEILTKITLAAKRHWGYPESWIQSWIPSLTITSAYILKHETWAAIIDKECVGYYSLKYEDKSLWLDNLWVLPEFMGQGIGKYLFQHALERSRAQGVYNIKIESDPNAQTFYEKMGAHKIGEHQTQAGRQPRSLPIMEINDFQEL